MTPPVHEPSGGAVVTGWLATRRPPAPAALSDRLLAMLGDTTAVAHDDVPELCIRTAERELARLLRGDQRARGCAVDLLAVDALVTYAMEAAADDPARLAARAEAAIAALSSLPEPN